MSAKAPQNGAARRRARSAQPATSYSPFPPQGNSEDAVWSCAVPPAEWPDWTDDVAFTVVRHLSKSGTRFLPRREASE